MILYSIIPHEVVFGNSEKVNDWGIMEINYLGEKVQVQPLDNNRYVIDRVITTSLKAYLNPGLQPGTIIRMGEQR